MRRFLLSAVALAVLSGCATLNEDQCRGQDWRGIGQKDGMEGQAPERLEAHVKACSKFAVLPDPVAWERGRAEGLELFCTPGRAYRHGAAGREYKGVCPRDVEQGWLQAYSDGRLVHAAERTASEAESDASSARGRANRLADDIRDAERRAADEKLTKEERDAARQDARRLRQDRAQYLDQASNAERYARDARAEAYRLRARFAAYYGGV